ERFAEAGHIQLKGRMTDFATIVERQNVDNDDVEESVIRKSKFLNLLKMKPKKAFVQRLRRPKNQHPTYKQGKKALDAKLYKDAITWLERALEHYPNSSTIQCDLAFAYMGSSDHKKSYKYVNQAIKNNPRNARAWTCRGEHHMMQAEFKQSLKNLEQSLDIKPNDAYTLSLRGKVFYMLNQYDNALTDLHKALKLDPENLIALKLRGEVFLSLRQVNNALNDLKSLDIEPYNADAQNCLCLCYQHGIGVEKDAKKAVELYEKAVEQGVASAQNSLGYCYEY